MIKSRYLFTSESVCEGHPDKICDQISDGILDACLEVDPESRVAIETLTKTGVVIVAGELTTQAYVNIPQIARQTLKEIGYTKSSYGIEYETCAVLVHIEEQSPDIAIGVDREGAGDQGMMFGYATAETDNFMPLPIDLAHKLTMKMAEVRKNGTLHYLGPDGKAQVTVEYENGKPLHVKAVVASNQHDENISHKQIEDDFLKLIIKPVCGDLLSADCKFYINPTGSFVRGGPYADAGLTGRKIIVDTYGGMGRHGGGCFSGKDPSKVDRSGAYAARYIAKNIVAAGIAEKCEVQVAYAIGIADPVSLNVNFFGTGKLSEERVEKMIREIFPLRPREIIKALNLKRPIYKKTASYGHFGRDEFPWEKLDKVEVIKKYAGI